MVALGKAYTRSCTEIELAGLDMHVTRVAALSLLVCLSITGAEACGGNEGSRYPSGYGDFPDGDSGYDEGPDGGDDAGYGDGGGDERDTDGGMNAPDAGPEPCIVAACAATGNDCLLAVCNPETGECEVRPVPDGTACGDRNNNQCTAPDTCQAGACRANHAPAGALCGIQGVECQKNDTCDGEGRCTINGPSAEGTPCGDRGVPCHVDDVCDGKGTCIDNGHAEEGSSCGDPTDNECDNPDTCNKYGRCLDNFEPPNTPCGDHGLECSLDDFCNGGGVCENGGYAEEGTPCGDPSESECNHPDTCNDSGDCLDNLEPVNTPCGSQNDSACGNPDTCDASGECLDNFEPPNTPCGDQGTPCRFDDFCDGGGTCLDKGFWTEGTPCGSSLDTECDNPDTCNASGSCLDNFTPPGVGCGDGSDTECDNPDSCNGAGACVANHEPAGFACGDPSDTECDNPDTCNGGGACLANHEPADAPCGDQGIDCRVDDACDGSGGCTDNGLSPPETPCGDPTDGECDNPNTCGELGECLDNHEPIGAPCGDHDVDCHNDDACDGLGGCTDNGPAVAGAPCGNPGDGECDDPDTCNGAGSCLDNLEPFGSPCGTQGVECQKNDTCDGKGGCTDNGLADSGTPCGDQGVWCHFNDACDNQGNCLDNGLAEPGTACGSLLDTECDNPNSCDAYGECLDNFEPFGSPCGIQGVECQKNDTCDGKGGCTDNGPTDSGTPCGDQGMQDLCLEDDSCTDGGVCFDNGITPDCKATVTGSLVDDTGNPFPGIVVEVMGIDPPSSTSTGLLGDFSLLAPMGVEVLFRFGDAAGYWGEIEVATFLPPDLDLGTHYLLSDALVEEELGGVAGLDPIDPAKGIVIVGFLGTSGLGGESASLSAASAPAFTRDDAGTYVVSLTDPPALLAGGGAELLFINVEVGATTVTVAGASGVNNCALAAASVTDWPVIAHTITWVDVACTPP